MKGAWLLLLVGSLASGLAVGPAGTPTSTPAPEPHLRSSRREPAQTSSAVRFIGWLGGSVSPLASPSPLNGERAGVRGEAVPRTSQNGQTPEAAVPPALRHQAYVWQRDWSPLVEAAVVARAPQLDRLVPLAAEVTWKQGQPSVVRPELPHALLARLGRPVGLALRIGPFAGPFATNDARANALAGLAATLLEEARAQALPVAELQLDFDCAEAKLDGYQRWVQAIRRRVAPMPVVFTALPAWLKRAEFPALARAADGFVLQVHSLAPPRGPDAPFTLCDPAAARQAVAKAGDCGVPFRVALPTYGYLVAFDARGKFIGLSAEGPSRTWPPDVQLRDVRANPVELAQLVAGWSTARPPSLQGILWYRLPVPGDRLNWTWPTLAAVMAGHAPAAALRAATHRPQRGLVEIELRNEGDRDATGAVLVSARWSGARLVACDGLAGFTVTNGSPQTIGFQSVPGRWPAGAARRIGWLRLEPETEVEVQIESMP